MPLLVVWKRYLLFLLFLNKLADKLHVIIHLFRDMFSCCFLCYTINGFMSVILSIFPPNLNALLCLVLLRLKFFQTCHCCHSLNLLLLSRMLL